MNYKKQDYSISELANEFNISTRTIRYYEELGLLNPNRDNNNKYRRYSRADRARLKLILRGKRFGFSLEEIREMIELFEVDQTGVKQLKRALEYGDQKITEIDDRIRELNELKEELLKLKEQFTGKINKFI